MSQTKIGKWFEKKVRDTLADLQTRNDLFFHHLQDSHTAGRIVNTVPADFLVSHEHEAQLWECKASETHYTLRSCLSDMVDDGQVGNHTIWHRTGLVSWFIFFSDQTDLVEIWDGRRVVAARIAGKPLPEVPHDTYELKLLKQRLLHLFNQRRHYD